MTIEESFFPACVYFFIMVIIIMTFAESSDGPCCKAHTPLIRKSEVRIADNIPYEDIDYITITRSRINNPTNEVSIKINGKTITL